MVSIGFGCSRRGDPCVERNDTATPPPARNPTPDLGPTQVEMRWHRLSWDLCAAARVGARCFMVLRARRIWGVLGNRIRRSLWCQAWRSLNAVPVITLRWVKVWKGTGR